MQRRVFPQIRPWRLRRGKKNLGSPHAKLGRSLSIQFFLPKHPSPPILSSSTNPLLFLLETFLTVHERHLKSIFHHHPSFSVFALHALTPFSRCSVKDFGGAPPSGGRPSPSRPFPYVSRASRRLPRFKGSRFSPLSATPSTSPASSPRMRPPPRPRSPRSRSLSGCASRQRSRPACTPT